MTYLEKRRELKLSGPASKEKKIYKIKPRSKKRVKEQKVYVAIVKEMAEESTDCELKVPGVCTGFMEGLDHQKKRGKYYLDRQFLKRCCNPCNLWKELHPKEALEMGISLSKFN